MSNKVLLSLDGKDKVKVATKLHKQFGHPNAHKLLDMLKKANITDKLLVKSIIDVSVSCEICRRFKKPCPRPVVSVPLASRFNEMISMDLKIWGKIYFLVIVDVATRFCIATIISNKTSETVIKSVILSWVALFGPPKNILSDNGCEFNNSDMREFGEAFNAKIMTTAAESPWSNGICERQNAVLADSVRKIMSDSNCSVDVALAWSVAARNSLSNHSGFSANQLVFGQNPNLPNAFINKPPALEHVSTSDIVRENLNAMHSARENFLKFESCEKLKRALRHNIRSSDGSHIENGAEVFYKRNDGHEWRGPGVVIGRDGKQFIVRHGGTFVRVHVCRLTKSPAQVENRVGENNELVREFRQVDRLIPVESVSCIESDDEISFEKCGGISETNKLATESCNELDSIENKVPDAIDLPTSPIPENSDKPKIKLKPGQRFKGIHHASGEIISGQVLSRAGKATGKYKDWYNIKKDCDGSQDCLDFQNDLSEWQIVDDHTEMLVFFNSEEISSAKDRELENWKNNCVFSEVDNNGQDVISVRWVVTEKYKGGKSIIKARLVARGFEEESSNLDKNSPTCSKEAVRLTLSVAASKKWVCHTVDIKSAFLQGNEISRDIFLKPPPEYDNGKLWKLHKTVYGLSDAARQWYITVKEQLILLGLSVSQLDPALFSWEHNGVVDGIICLYVDDFLWCGTEDFETKIIEKFNKLFLIGSRASKAFKYIGLNIENRPNDCVTVDQFDYARTLKSIPVSRERAGLKSSMLSTGEKSEYRALLGQLNWIATHTRPDIAFDVCELSVSYNNATISDLLKLNKVIVRVTTDNVRLFFPRIERLSECCIECYSDASFANLPGSGSQGGFIIFLTDSNHNRCPVFWQSRKIKRVVKSTLAAETLAMVDCVDAAIYIRAILYQICKCENIPIHCYVDNKSLLDTLKSKRNVDDKRLRIDLAVLQDLLCRKEICSVSWIESSKQLADCLTKKGASTEQLRAAISRD